MTSSTTALEAHARWDGASLAHTGVVTPDLDRSVHFWTAVMGFVVSSIGERRQQWLGKLIGVPNAEVRLAHLCGHGGALEFIEFKSASFPAALLEVNRPGATHLCLRVRDVAKLRLEILAAGGTDQGELTEISEGVAAGLSGLYMRDPQGLLIELIELPKS